MGNIKSSHICRDLQDLIVVDVDSVQNCGRHPSKVRDTGLGSILTIAKREKLGYHLNSDKVCSTVTIESGMEKGLTSQGKLGYRGLRGL